MFYIQTQDGNLPYIWKPYMTERGAEKAATAFMAKHHQAGAIAVVRSPGHETITYMSRAYDGWTVTVERLPTDDAE